MSQPEHRICIAMPHYNRPVDIGSAYGLTLWPGMPGKGYVMNPTSFGCSMLTQTFNVLLNTALNPPSVNPEFRFTHMAMLHSDVVPEPYWLHKLYTKLIELNADVLSVAIPIKTDDGNTSTAIGRIDNKWELEKYITMHELYDSLPETFNAADCGYPDNPLLINTGCWIADLRRPFWTDVDENNEAKFCFDVRNRRVKLPDGTFRADYQPEDWRFGRALWEAGAKVYATRCVKVDHFGEKSWTNSRPWGTKKVGASRMEPACQA